MGDRYPRKDSVCSPKADAVIGDDSKTGEAAGAGLLSAPANHSHLAEHPLPRICTAGEAAGSSALSAPALAPLLDDQRLRKGTVCIQEVRGSRDVAKSCTHACKSAPGVVTSAISSSSSISAGSKTPSTSPIKQPAVDAGNTTALSTSSSQPTSEAAALGTQSYGLSGYDLPDCPSGADSCPSGTNIIGYDDVPRCNGIEHQQKENRTVNEGGEEVYSEQQMISKTLPGGERLGEEVLQVSGRTSQSSMSPTAPAWPNQPGELRPDTCNASRRTVE